MPSFFIENIESIAAGDNSGKGNGKWEWMPLSPYYANNLFGVTDLFVGHDRESWGVFSKYGSGGGLQNEYKWDTFYDSDYEMDRYVSIPGWQNDDFSLPEPSWNLSKFDFYVDLLNSFLDMTGSVSYSTPLVPGTGDDEHVYYHNINDGPFFNSYNTSEFPRYITAGIPSGQGLQTPWFRGGDDDQNRDLDFTDLALPARLPHSHSTYNMMDPAINHDYNEDFTATKLQRYTAVFGAFSWFWEYAVAAEYAQPYGAWESMISAKSFSANEWLNMFCLNDSFKDDAECVVGDWPPGVWGSPQFENGLYFDSFPTGQRDRHPNNQQFNWSMLHAGQYRNIGPVHELTFRWWSHVGPDANSGARRIDYDMGGDPIEDQLGFTPLSAAPMAIIEHDDPPMNFTIHWPGDPYMEIEHSQPSTYFSGDGEEWVEEFNITNDGFYMEYYIEGLIATIRLEDNYGEYDDETGVVLNKLAHAPYWGDSTFVEEGLYENNPPCPPEAFTVGCRDYTIQVLADVAYNTTARLESNGSNGWRSGLSDESCMFNDESVVPLCCAFPTIGENALTGDYLGDANTGDDWAKINPMYFSQAQVPYSVKLRTRREWLDTDFATVTWEFNTKRCWGYDGHGYLFDMIVARMGLGPSNLGTNNNKLYDPYYDWAALSPPSENPEYWAYPPWNYIPSGSNYNNTNENVGELDILFYMPFQEGAHLQSSSLGIEGGEQFSAIGSTIPGHRNGINSIEELDHSGSFFIKNVRLRIGPSLHAISQGATCE